jgi:L-proline amide hydrolase
MTFTFDDLGNPEATTTGCAPFGEFQTWYRVTGSLDSDLTPVIAIHGGPGGSHDYISPLSQMALSGRPIIHYDQIGCGYSSVLSDEQVSQLTVEFFLDELENLIDHLDVADDFIILGHSWGGMMAQEFALRQPTGLSGLILSSSLASAAAWGAEVHRLAALLPEGFGEKYQAMMAGEELSDEEYGALDTIFTREHVFRAAPTWPDHGFQFPNAVYFTLWGRSEFDFNGLLGNWSVVERLHEITVPTFVVWGEHDESTALVNQEILNGIPHATSAEIPGGAHVTWVDAAEPYFAAVLSFADSLD